MPIERPYASRMMQTEFQTELIEASSASIRRAADLLHSGQVVAFPTETVYGLGANALNAEAVARIFAAKGRPATDPLIVHLARVDQIEEYADVLTQSARTLMKAGFMPGPLTLIVQARELIPEVVRANQPTVGLRVPSHPVAHDLLTLSDLPIAAPSANLFAHISPTSARHVYDDLQGRIPLILDGGSSTIGLESTIVDVSGHIPRLLRPGGVTVEQLRAVLPEIEVVERFAAPDESDLSAPGQLFRHYAPRVPLTLYESDERLIADVGAALNQGLRVGVVIGGGAGGIGSLSSLLSSSALQVVEIGEDATQVAVGLYKTLRQLEQTSDVIYVRTLDGSGIGAAIRDRLIRAASGRIVR